MKNYIDILQGIVNVDDLDDYDHLAMPNYLKIINESTIVLSNKVFGEINLNNNYSKRFVAARCNLEFKNELLLGKMWKLNARLIELKDKYINIDFRLRSEKQIKFKAIIVLVSFNLNSRKSEFLTAKEQYLLKDFFIK